MLLVKMEYLMNPRRLKPYKTGPFPNVLKMSEVSLVLLLIIGGSFPAMLTKLNLCTN